MNEIWRPVIGWEDCYMVSDHGNVMRIKSARGTLKNRMLKPFFTRYGYLCVKLSDGEKQDDALVHRLVAKAFLPNPLNKEFVDHIDCNRTNNFVDNLRWVTMLENNNNPITKERQNQKKRNKTGVLSNHRNAIFCIELQRVFFGAWEAARILGINKSNIGCAIKGRRKTCGGYHWRYATAEEIKQAKVINN